MLCSTEFHDTKRGTIEYTVNVDIFTCITFCVFTKIGNFTWIKIHVLRMIGSLCYYNSNFHDAHIFVDI